MAPENRKRAMMGRKAANTLLFFYPLSLLRRERKKKLTRGDLEDACLPIPRCSLPPLRKDYPMSHQDTPATPKGQMTLADAILYHLDASGPATFEGIRIWLAHQYCQPAEPDKIATTLTALIRCNRVRLYDTGDAYDSVPPPASSLII